MWESFVLLFAEMSPLVAVFFILGILFCIIELFIPGFGVFGVSGVILIAAGIVIRMINGGDIYMFVYMAFFSILIIGGMFIIVSRSISKGKLGKTKIFDIGTAVPTGTTEGTKDYSYLLNAEGVAETFLRPVGVGDFNGELVDVMAKSGIIDEGSKIKVTYVEGQKVVVEKIENI